MSETEAIYQSFVEACMQHEVEANERRLKWCRERILNQGKERTGEPARRAEQVSKQDRELAMKQAMMNWNE